MRYYKNLSIDESNCTVKKEGQPIHLTTMEYQYSLRCSTIPGISVLGIFCCHPLGIYNADSDTDGRCAYRKAAEETGLGAK